MKTFLTIYMYLMRCVSMLSGLFTGMLAGAMVWNEGAVTTVGWLLLTIGILLSLYSIVTGITAEWVLDKEYYR